MNLEQLLLMGQLAAAVGGGVIPDGWEQTDRYTRPIVGTEMNLYSGPGGQQVLAIEGINGVRDAVFAPFKRVFGYSPQVLDYVRTLQEANPNLTVVGHSGGGLMASWLGGQLGVPTYLQLSPHQSGDGQSRHQSGGPLPSMAISGAILIISMAAHYRGSTSMSMPLRYSEMSILIKDVYYCKKYLQQKNSVSR